MFRPLGVSIARRAAPPLTEDANAKINPALTWYGLLAPQPALNPALTLTNDKYRHAPQDAGGVH